MGRRKSEPIRAVAWIDGKYRRIEDQGVWPLTKDRKQMKKNASAKRRREDRDSGY